MTDIQIIKKLLRNNDRMMEQLEEIKLAFEVRELSPWLTVKEAAAYSGFSLSHFYKIYEEIPHFQRDKRIMIRCDDLEGWMQKNKKKAPAVTGAIN